MRNPNGYGSIYKLSGKRRNPWTARVTVGYKDNGQGNYKYIGYYPTKAEAMIALAEYNKSPYDIDNKKVTLEDIWEIFKQRNLNDCKGSSKEGIYFAAWGHLKPLSKLKMTDIKTYQMQKLIDGIDRKWQTKSHIKMLLGQLFKIAIELDVCSKNYAEYIKLDNSEHSEIHKVFTADEINILFDNVLTSRCAPFALILIYTGMRPSELLKIKTENVDIDKRIMKGGIKTKAGKNRIIPINHKILSLIKCLYNPNNTYLVEQNGKPVTYPTFKKWWDNDIDVIKSHLPHDGRHTFASLMDTAGANKLAIKKIMGHASQDITDSVYTHKTEDELLKCIDMLG